jgi:hypothetical protein
MLAALLVFLFIFLAGAISGYGLRSYVSRHRRLKRQRASMLETDLPDEELEQASYSEVPFPPPRSSDALHNQQA